MAGGLAKAESLPANTVDLLLGAALGPDGARGVANLDINFGEQVSAFVGGEFANEDDWSTVAGLKVIW